MSDRWWDVAIACINAGSAIACAVIERKSERDKADSADASSTSFAAHVARQKGRGAGVKSFERMGRPFAVAASMCTPRAREEVSGGGAR